MSLRRWMVMMTTAMQGGGAGAAPVLLQATFTDDDGTSLDVYVPDIDISGNGFVEESGDWIISSNKAAPTGVDPGDWYALHDAEQSDVIVQSSVRTSTTSAVLQILIRYVDSTHLWRVQWQPNTGAFAIYERDGGTFVLRASDTLVGAADTDYLIRVVANGTTITATIDGGTEISYASALSSLTATRHGFGCNISAGRFDDFQINPT